MICMICTHTHTHTERQYTEGPAVRQYIEGNPLPTAPCSGHRGHTGASSLTMALCAEAQGPAVQQWPCAPRPRSHVIRHIGPLLLCLPTCFSTQRHGSSAGPYFMASQLLFKGAYCSKGPQAGHKVLHLCTLFKGGGVVP